MSSVVQEEAASVFRAAPTPAPTTRIIPTNDAVQLADGFFYGCYKKCNDAETACTVSCGANVCDSNDTSCRNNVAKYLNPMYKIEGSNLKMFVENMMDPNQYKIYKDGDAYLPRSYVHENVYTDEEANAFVKQFSYLDTANPPRLDKMLSYVPPADACIKMTPCVDVLAATGVCCSTNGSKYEDAPRIGDPLRPENVNFSDNFGDSNDPLAEEMGMALIVQMMLAYATQQGTENSLDQLSGLTKGLFSSEKTEKIDAVNNIQKVIAPTLVPATTITPPPPVVKTSDTKPVVAQEVGKLVVAQEVGKLVVKQEASKPVVKQDAVKSVVKRDETKKDKEEKPTHLDYYNNFYFNVFQIVLLVALVTGFVIVSRKN